MTFKQQFNAIKKELNKRDTKNLSQNIAVQITLDDEDCGGTFYVSNMDGKFEVAPYDYFDNTLYLNTTAPVLMQMLTGELDGADALFRGLLSGAGDWAHGQEVLALPKKKTAAKKPAAKKTAAKKPAAKKTAAKKPAAKKAAEKKTATKTAAKKPAAKKAAAPKAAEKKTATKAAAKKPAAKKAAAPKAAEKKTATKSAAKKPATKKPAAKKTAAKK